MAAICTRAAVLPRSTARHLVLWRMVFACGRDKFNGWGNLRCTHAARNLSLQPLCVCCAKILASKKLGKKFGRPHSSWCLRLLVKAEFTTSQDSIGWKSPLLLCERYYLAAAVYASYIRLRESVCVWGGAQFHLHGAASQLGRWRRRASTTVGANGADFVNE